MNVVEGDPDIYIDCDEIPRELLNARWKSEGLGIETVAITKKEFQKYERQCNTLYIVVNTR